MIEERKFYWALLDSLDEGVYFADHHRKITYWNKAAELMTGFKAQEVLGRWCGNNILCHIDEEGNNLCEGDCPLSHTLETGQPNEKRIYLHHKDGYRVPVMVHVNPVFGAGNKPIGAVELFSDLSTGEAMLKNAQSEDVAGYYFSHSLTGLPNRRYLEMNLKMKLFEWKEFEQAFGVFALKMENLEQIKKSYKRASYEKMMKTFCETVIHNLNTSDIVGEWQEGLLVGLVGRSDQEKLITNAGHYRVLLEKTDLPGNGEPDSISFSLKTAMIKAGDSLESLIERIT
jgi:PAS domain S-box-containing protein